MMLQDILLKCVNVLIPYVDFWDTISVTEEKQKGSFP